MNCNMNQTSVRARATCNGRVAGRCEGRPGGTGFLFFYFLLTHL